MVFPYAPSLSMAEHRGLDSRATYALSHSQVADVQRKSALRLLLLRVPFQRKKPDPPTRVIRTFLVEHRGLDSRRESTQEMQSISDEFALQTSRLGRSRSQTSAGSLLCTARPSSPLFKEKSPIHPQGMNRTFLVEHRGLEPLTPTLPVSCAPSCANAPKIDW